MATEQQMMAFDEEVGRKLELLIAAPAMVARRQRVIDAAQLELGQHCLDLGSGPGAMSCELAERLGPKGRVTAIDNSPAMLAMTQQRARRHGVTDRVEVREGDAVALPLADATLDAVVVVRVYEYVPDVGRALAEAYRVLRPGGRLVIVDSDSDTIVLHTDDPALNARILRAFHEHYAHRTLPRRLSGLLRRAGFQVAAIELVPILDLEFTPTTYSFSGIGLVANFVRGRAGVTAADVDAWLADIERQNANDTYFFSENEYLFQAIKPDSDSGV